MPDANTLWDFREALIAAGALEGLFARLDRAINGEQPNAIGPREAVPGYLPRGGQILDATLIAAPRQRNAEGEKARIREGRSAADIGPDRPAKARQKDVDGRWTVKHSKAKVQADGSKPIDIAIPVYGYKSPVSIDRMHGIIRSPPTPPGTTAPGSARGRSTAGTRPGTSGPTAPGARPGTRTGWPTMA